MIVKAPEVGRSPRPAPGTPAPAIGAAGPRPRPRHGARVRRGGGHGGGEVGGSLAGVGGTARAGSHHTAPVYGGGGGVAPVEVPEGGGRSLAVAREWVRGVGGVQGSDRGRVEIVLRSDVGGAGAGAAGRASGEGRGHSWNKWKSKLINTRGLKNIQYMMLLQQDSI